MARYTVHVKTKHDHLDDGPSDLVVTMHGDKKILQDVENYALHYEEMSKRLATAEADKKQLAEQSNLFRRQRSRRSEAAQELAECFELACLRLDFAETNLKKSYAREDKLKAERDQLKAENERLRKSHNAVIDLIEQSQGVYGLHLNGDGAPWETLRTGGQFEEWLIDFDKAALREVDGGKD